MDVPDRNQATSWEGKPVVDRDGERLGTCRGVFADTETGVTEWLDVDVDGGARSFVPALEAVEAGDAVRVAFLRAAVLSAPTVGDQEQLSKRDETELYRHYGVPVETDGSVLPTDAPVESGGAPLAAASSTGTLASTDDVAPTGVLPSTSDDTTAGVFASGKDRTAVDAEAERSGAAAGGVADGNGALGEHALALDTATTPETGLDLPVLDPAAASVPIPEDEVVYVDDREPFMEQGERDEPEADEGPAAAAAPRLSRVPQDPAPSASSWPPPSSSQGPGALETGAPLAGVAALAATVYVVLRTLEQRRRRRNSAAARAERVRRQVGAGSRAARASAARSLTAGSVVAATTGRQLSAAASAASREAAQKQRELAAAAASASRDAAKKRRELAAAAATASAEAAKKRRELAAAAGQASSEAAKKHRKARRKAARQAQRQQRQLAASLASASAAAARTGAAATGAVTAVPAAVGSSLSDAARSVSTTSRGTTSRSTTSRRAAKKAAKARRAAARRGRSTSSSLSSAPRTVAKKGRRVRRSLARKAWELVLAAAAGGGYVLGAKAGRERYEEIQDVAQAVAASPQVQNLTETVTDPERRSQLVSRLTSRAGR